MSSFKIGGLLPWLVFMAALLGGATPLLAAECHPMTPRVPADKHAEARALTNPLSDSSALVEKGKGLYLQTIR